MVREAPWWSWGSQPPARPARHAPSIRPFRRCRREVGCAHGKARLHRSRRDELHLLWGLRVELEHRPRAAREGAVQRGEEEAEPPLRHVRRLVRVAQPLHGGDADRAVQRARAERQAAAHVQRDEVALVLALVGNGEHGGADVAADPRVALLLQHFAAQPGAAADIRQQQRLALRQRQQLQGALGHLLLDVHDARALRVLLRLRVIVEQLRRRRVLRPAHEQQDQERASSQREHSHRGIGAQQRRLSQTGRRSRVPHLSPAAAVAHEDAKRPPGIRSVYVSS